MTRLFHATRALLADGWHRDVAITVASDGRIASLTPESDPRGADRLGGPVLPGMPNLHSHAFQRAVAGLTERASGGREDFWSWREAMYRFVARLTPDQVEAIAAQLYAEMLEQGYTTVGEFHYLHHGPDGAPYATATEMSDRIVAAAQASGIRLTLLPVLYMAGGFGGQPTTDGQRRFRHDPDSFVALVQSLRSRHGLEPRVRIGVAPHSLRAVTDDALTQVLATLKADDPSLPIHIHIAEQTREVDECLAWSGHRSVEHLFHTQAVDGHWCLVHATHLDHDEIAAIARSQAVVGICATTEANLGDGIFPTPAFLAENGRFGVGSDSHITVDPAAELRLIEYGQRLTQRRRAILAGDGRPSVGRLLHDRAMAGGATACGWDVGGLRVGAPADFIALDGGHPLIADRDGDDVLDSYLFAGDGRMVDRVIVGGETVVANGRHVARESLRGRCRAALRELAGD